MKVIILLLFIILNHSIQAQHGGHAQTNIEVIPAADYTVRSISSGNWSDPSTWNGRLPRKSDKVLIAPGHRVIVDFPVVHISGMLIAEGAELSFHATKSASLQSDSNIVVNGILRMRPSSAKVVHLIRFNNIKEELVVGDGMEVLGSDVGLWVMNRGQLDLEGSDKTLGWINAASGVKKGQANVDIQRKPGGWQNGDEVVITPTEAPTVGKAYIKGFEERKIVSVENKTLRVDQAFEHDHPKINARWTAELLNLTRNVRIEGTATGHAHVFICSNSPQHIRWTQFRYMGPRKDRNGDGRTELILGRYGLHFHHSMDGSRGSIVEYNVIRDTENHAYVPHVSHGITFRGNIAYNTTEVAFWWDERTLTHDNLWEGNIVARNKFVERSLARVGRTTPTLSSRGYVLGMGNGNVARGNVAVGIEGKHGGGYSWDADNEGLWVFENNMTHNSESGLRVWQNTHVPHIIQDFTAYNCGTFGIFHGAYVNSYRYTGGFLYGNDFHLKAASMGSSRLTIENMVIDGAGFVDYPLALVQGNLPGPVPVLLRNVTIKGQKKAAIYNSVNKRVKTVDLVNCNINEKDIAFSADALPDEYIRVQRGGGTAYQITKDGRKPIALFAPLNWGTGSGLKAEYFQDADLQQSITSRVEANTDFGSFKNETFPYQVKKQVYSIRWTGFVEPQYTEEYTINVETGGGVRVWINEELLVDSWKERYPGTLTTTPIHLQAGKKYPIRIEYFNKDEKSKLRISWQSASVSKEYIPQRQLYPGTDEKLQANNRAR